MKQYTIGIIGGTGEMGRWFENFFAARGHTVLIAGRKTPLTYKDIARKSNVVILSTPLDAAVRICKDIGPMLGEEQLLTDFCSLKETIVQSMLDHSKAQVIGLHPMFGPYTDSLNGQNMILCPGRGNDWITWMEALFQNEGAFVTRMDPVVHDKYMAVVQGLIHMLSICLGKTLQKMNLTPKTLQPYSTPIFRLNMDLTGRLFAQDLGLYSSLISKNVHVKDVIDTFSDALGEGKKNMFSDSNEERIAYLENIRGFLGDFCEDALAESNTILNALYSGKDYQSRIDDTKNKKGISSIPNEMP